MVKSAVVSTKTSKTNSNFSFKYLISFKLTLILFLDEPTDINAKDIFQKKSEIKSVQNNVTIIKNS